MHVEVILESAKWNITRAAEILDIDRVTLYNKIAKYGLKKP
jgi:transcriptional regulator of acetoin/glycerol metabolism